MNTAQVTTGYKKLQDEVFSSTRKLWLAGLGTLSTVEAESSEIFDQLVKRGRLVEEKSRKRLSKTKADLESGTDELAEKLDRQVSGVLQKMGVPSRAQVQDLTLRVEQLTEQVDRLTPAKPVKKSTTPARTTKTTKTAAKA
jgi:poly(hydroxyalkanoate) granule-associated protein